MNSPKPSIPRLRSEPSPPSCVQERGAHMALMGTWHREERRGGPSVLGGGCSLAQRLDKMLASLSSLLVLVTSPVLTWGVWNVMGPYS